MEWMVCCRDTAGPLESCPHQQIFFGVLISALGLSIALNIYCCASKRSSGKRHRQDTRRKMEDNPIYGNIVRQTTQAALESSFASSVRRDQLIINDNSQDCYANLSLQGALPDSRPSAPLVPAGVQDKNPDHPEVRPDPSELYASVQTRTKILQNPDSAEEYANHL